LAVLILTLFLSLFLSRRRRLIWTVVAVAVAGISSSPVSSLILSYGRSDWRRQSRQALLPSLLSLLPFLSLLLLLLLIAVPSSIAAYSAINQ
jgi:hypothetical protein